MKVLMQPNQITALKLVEQAQAALKSGDRSAARQFASQAARLAPELEEVWLMLAALAGPQASLEYLRQAAQGRRPARAVRICATGCRALGALEVHAAFEEELAALG